jgi:hypothetical protein
MDHWAWQHLSDWLEIRVGMRVGALLCIVDAPLTVAVEGKADEEFDVPLWRYREKGLQRSKDTGSLRRIDALVHRWFRTSLTADRAEPPLICLGYQLFSALAGTLADAKIHGSRQAVLLIMEYVTDLTDDAEHARNARMLDNF